jgi:plastocyanin
MTFRQRLGLVVVLGVVLTTLGASLALAADPSASPGTSPAASGGSESGGKVELVDKSFAPKRLVVAQGTDVVWTVTKAIAEPHSVTSGKNGDADAGKLFNSDIKLKSNGDTFKFNFATPGTYSYFCQVHPVEMTGEIVVLAPGQTAPPEASQPANGGEANALGDHKVVAAAILGVALIVLFGSAWLYRRVNPA